jgi:hypothetical protein
VVAAGNSGQLGLQAHSTTAIRFTGVPQGEPLYKPLAKYHHAPANVELLLSLRQII